MKLFFAKHPDGSITHANILIQENGADHYEFEVASEDLSQITEGTKDWNIDSDKLSLIDSDRKKRLEDLENEQAKKGDEVIALKSKLQQEKLSLEEIQTIISNLL